MVLAALLSAIHGKVDMTLNRRAWRWLLIVSVFFLDSLVCVWCVLVFYIYIIPILSAHCQLL